MSALTKSEVALFHEKGYLKVNEVFELEYVLKLQDEIWDELEEEFSIIRTDSTSWTTPPRSPRKAKFSQTNDRLINDHFRSIINDLIGQDTWEEPKSWGGFLINFPEQEPKSWDLANKLWHWDYELFRQPELGGLLIFSFFSEVQPKGGGTLIVSGSHHSLREYYTRLTPEQKRMKHGAQRKHFMRTHPYFKKLTDPKLRNSEHVEWFMSKSRIIDEIPLQIIELTGKPGDVVFCHPRLIHAPAAINLNKNPRIMRTKFLW